MNIILLQALLTPQEHSLLLKEFPSYLFLTLSEAGSKNLAADQWHRVEILFGSRLTKEELAMAANLRWLHSPVPHLSRICLPEIEKQGHILVTNTVDENVAQIGEFAMSGILAFAKHLFEWREVNKEPPLVWRSKWRDSMWGLQEKVILLVGMGKAGTEVAKRTRQMEMKVWGMQRQRSFHPHCHKTFAYEDLPLVLPEADVVCVSLADGKERHQWFGRTQLKQMKEDSILIILGNSSLVDEEALAEIAQTGKFRGILLDAPYQKPIPATSVLWTIPNLLITPEVAPRPKSKERLAFRLFLYNLRQFLCGNFADMRNLIDKTVFFNKR